jgi:hypothetical protein
MFRLMQQRNMCGLRGFGNRIDNASRPRLFWTEPVHWSQEVHQLSVHTEASETGKATLEPRLFRPVRPLLAR